MRPDYRIPTDLLLKAYASGVFPMAESAADPEVFWVRPETRGIIPLDAFHIPKSLAKAIRQGRFEVTLRRRFRRRHRRLRRDRARTAATPGSTRRSAKPMSSSIGAAIATRSRPGATARLVGGLYGVSLGRAFFGESMFSRERDASKICLVHLVERLNERGFALLDTQFTTEHLKRFGAVDVPRRKYEKLLAKTLEGQAQFFP